MAFWVTVKVRGSLRPISVSTSIDPDFALAGTVVRMNVFVQSSEPIIVEGTVPPAPSEKSTWPRP